MSTMTSSVASPVLASATARSVWPLPKSPATIASGVPATGKPIVVAGWNVPSPLPSEIEMLSVRGQSDGHVEVADRR